MRQGETGCGGIPLSVAAGSPGARSIGYGLGPLRFQPFVRRSRRVVVILASPKRYQLTKSGFLVTVIRSFGLNSTNLTGPVPIGWLRMSRGLT
jgi:hypothetical protein